MVRSADRRLPVIRALALIGLGAVLAAACGGPQPQVGSGAVCFRSEDCKPGFACVAEVVNSSKHICSADLSSIVFMVDGAPPEAAAPSGGEAGSSVGGTGAEPTSAGAAATGGAHASNGGSASGLGGTGGGLSAGTGG